MKCMIRCRVGQQFVDGRRAKALLGASLLSFASLIVAPFVSSNAEARTSIKSPKSAALTFGLPFSNGRITSRFHQGRWHPGIDLAAPTGTPIAATTSSQKVSFSGRKGGYGNTVITRDALGRTHVYAHLQTIDVRVGQVLARGQKIGAVGSTGFSTGPHLHYEIKSVSGKHIDPALHLFSRPRTS